MTKERQAKKYYERLMREGFNLDNDRYDRMYLRGKGFDTDSFNEREYLQSIKNIIRALAQLKERNVERYMGESTDQFIHALIYSDLDYRQLIDVFVDYSGSLK